MAPEATDLGDLPRWNLDDLYPGIESPELAQAFTDLASDCAAFEEKYKGRLSDLSGDDLGQAIADYEVCEEVMGRIGSFAEVAGGAVLMSARLWPGEEAGAVSHEHPDLPPDHPHLQAHGGARHHSHEIIIDDEHLHWPARG